MTGPPAFVYWIRELVDRVVESLTPAELPDPDEIFNPPQFPQFPPPVCFAAVVTTEGEARCDVQINEVGDARTGRSFTTTASANFCRQEPSGEECVGTTQSVGRTGAEADPRVGQESGPVALPQACVGSTCTPPGALSNAPRKVTVFNAGTTPEASVYTGTGAVNANAPQACVSIDDSCTGTGTSGTTKSAGLENVSATQLVTTQ